MSMPADAMANMTPQQKAQMEAMMKQMAASGPKTITERSCVTDKDIREGAFHQRAEDDKNALTSPWLQRASDRK